MQKPLIPTPPLSHDLTLANHRRQVMLQVWVPLGLSLVVFLALVGLTLFGAAGFNPAVSSWASVSFILLIMPVLGSVLVLTLVVMACIYGMNKLLYYTQAWLLVAQLRVYQVALLARIYADRVIEPVYKVHEANASWKRFWHDLGQFFKGAK